jgi:hypothetical protein
MKSCELHFDTKSSIALSLLTVFLDTHRYDLKQGLSYPGLILSLGVLTKSGVHRDIKKSSLEGVPGTRQARSCPAQGVQRDEKEAGCGGPGLSCIPELGCRLIACIMDCNMLYVILVAFLHISLRLLQTECNIMLMKAKCTLSLPT